MMSEDGLGSSASGGAPVAAVTGANGYLGSVLAAAFGSAGFSVRRLVRSPVHGSSDRAFDLASHGPSDALIGADVLVHCAYDMKLNNRSDIWQTNVFGSIDLFDMAVSSGVRRTITLSSMSAYAGTRQLYGRAKLDVEVSALSRGMVVVRPGLVYGPGWGGMAGTLRRLAKLPVLPDFGPKAHQFTVSEDDFATAVVALATAGHVPTHPVGLAHPDPVSFRTLLTTFARRRRRGTTAVRAHATHGRLWRPAGGGAHEAEPAGAGGLPPRPDPACTGRAESRGDGYLGHHLAGVSGRARRARQYHSKCLIDPCAYISPPQRRVPAIRSG